MKEEKSTKYEGALYYLMTETIELNNNVLIPIAQQAHDDLLELVNRDKPMKPKLVWKNEEDKNIVAYRCLNCNGSLGAKLDDKPMFPNFCRHCGQKLDWSNEK